MEKIELKDFLDFKFLSNVEVNGKKDVVFCMSSCNEAENSYDRNIYMIKDGKTSILTNGAKESNFILLDDETVVFSAVREKADLDKLKAKEELSVFNKISLNGGEAEKLFAVPLSVVSFLNVDADTFVLQVDYDTRYSCMYNMADKSEVLKNKSEDADYEIFTQIPFYFNAEGYTSNHVSRLFLYKLSTDTLIEMTPTDIDVNTFILSDDRSKVYFTASKVLSKPSLKDSVHAYDLSTGKMETLLDEKDYSISAIKMFSDNLLIVANKEVTYGQNENPKWFIMDLNSQKISLLNHYQDSIGNSVGSDCRFGGGQSIKVYNDQCYFIATIDEKAVLQTIDTNGHIENVLIVDGSIDCFDIVEDIIYLIAMKDGALQEVYAYDFRKVHSLTNINTKLKNKYVAQYNEIKYENDGVELSGWVLLPENYDASKTYPAILDIHGGPKTVYGKVYYHEMQLWANMGYIVFFTNPRGSDGRGNDFMDIFGKYGTIDYDDLMKFTDVVMNTYAIDPTKMGVTGGSYGGFMSNWIITHTDRFACAATQRSISNWLSFYGTSDIGFLFAEDQIHGNVFHSPQKLWEHSPLKYAKKVTTPTLFIHSDEDYRCPLEQGLQLFTALVDQGIEAKFVMFKGENHELSRSGKPVHRIKRLTEITNWMETHLK